MWSKMSLCEVLVACIGPIRAHTWKMLEQESVSGSSFSCFLLDDTDTEGITWYQCVPPHCHLSCLLTGLAKLCTLGFLFIGQLVDFLLILLQVVGPADRSQYFVPFYGPILMDVNTADPFLPISNQTCAWYSWCVSCLYYALYVECVVMIHVMFLGSTSVQGRRQRYGFSCIIFSCNIRQHNWEEPLMVVL